MNYPKYLARCPDMVCHPSSVLKEAAKAFQIDAAELRKVKMRKEAESSERAARVLLGVANGSSWAEALELQYRRPTASQESAQSIKEE